MTLRLLPFWCRTASVFLIRSGKTTCVLGTMVLTSVATLILLSALAVGVNDAMVRNSVRLFSGHLSGSDLPGTLSTDALRVPGVSSVLRRSGTPGLLTNENGFEWVTLIGVNPEEESRTTALPSKRVAGRYIEAGKREIFLSQAVAERVGVGIGDELSFREGKETSALPLQVAGIYRTGIEPLDRGVAFCPSDILEEKLGPWNAAIFLKDGESPEAVAAQYGERSAPGQEFKTWSEMMPDLRQLIDLNYVSMTIVTVVVFGLVAIGISGAFVIFILKNLREYGIVKSMGVTSGEMTFLLAIEVVLLNLAASVIGTALGVAAVVLLGDIGIDLTAFTSHNRYFAVSGVVYPRLTTYSLWLPPLVAFGFSLGASAWPAAMLARKRPAEILRSL